MTSEEINTDAFDSEGKVILRLDDVHKTFVGKRKGKKVSTFAVRGVSTVVHEGEVLGIVGESGCGKTTIARMIAGLEMPTRGAISFDGSKLKNFTKQIRRKISMVFQDPYASLNPRMNAESIIREPMHLMSETDLTTSIDQLTGDNSEAANITSSKRKKEKQLAGLLMETVQLRKQWAHRYPHEFSGGQRQRIGIARALATSPELLVLDEPVSALDVSVQAGIINFLKALKSKSRVSMIFISHDLRIVKHVCDRVIVMYLGQIMEDAPSELLFSHPRHPYTRALMASIPTKSKSVDDSLNSASSNKDTVLPFSVIRGDLPNPSNPPSGCPFRTRCERATEACEIKPPLAKMTDGRLISCHFPY